jgi:hypothetical protein
MSRFESWDEQVKAAKEAKARADEQAAEAGVEALAEEKAALVQNLNKKNRRPFPLLCVALIAIVLGCSVVAFFVGRGFRPDQTDSTAKGVSSARRLHPNMPLLAEIAVLEKYESDELYAQERSTDDLAEKLAEHRDWLAGIAATMPPDDDKAVWEMLKQALQYFDSKDTIEIWMNCRDAAKPFLAQGTTPKDTLLGALAVMKALEIRPDRKQKMRRFVVSYTEWRTEDKLDHLSTLAEIIKRRQFSN